MKYLLMGTSSNFGNMFSMAGASPSPSVLADAPRRRSSSTTSSTTWLRSRSRPTTSTRASCGSRVAGTSTSSGASCSLIGPISSVYDFLTFFVLLKVLLHASEPHFHTGWFVESLATQTLVIFVIRTAAKPFRSRPSPALARRRSSSSRQGSFFRSLHRDMVRLRASPTPFFAFLAAATATYLLLVELVKRRLFRRLFV